jgi:tetrahydromethanopterin S-methyltransferase subunit C
MEMEQFRLWLIAALVRAVKTMAQSAVALIGTTTVSVTSLDWRQIIAVAITAGILSILTSVAGVPEVDEGTSPLGK